MRTRTCLTVAAAAAALALGAIAPASATVQPHTTDVLTVGSAGGTNVATGNAISAGLASGTKVTFFSSTTGNTGVTCTGSQFGASVTSNPASPGTAGLSVTSLTFSGCTANVTGVTSVGSITVTTPFSASVASGGAVSIPGPVTTTVVLNTLLGPTTCKFSGSGVAGTASNADHSISFSNQPFTLTSGSSLCFPTVYWTAKAAPVVDTSLSSQPVFFN